MIFVLTIDLSASTRWESRLTRWLWIQNTGIVTKPAPRNKAAFEIGHCRFDYHRGFVLTTERSIADLPMTACSANTPD